MPEFREIYLINFVIYEKLKLLTLAETAILEFLQKLPKVLLKRATQECWSQFTQ